MTLDMCLDESLEDLQNGGGKEVAIAIVDSATGMPIEWTTLELNQGFGRSVSIYVSKMNDHGADALERNGFVRDPDVLDTWFSSATWPLSTLGWPNNEGDTAGLLDAFNPTSVLTTAREIITLWVSRMVMFNRYFTGGDQNGQVPFNDVFIHAMIQDGEGRKMSKSLGNGVDPLDIIHSHGADAMRFTLCQMTTNTQDVRMPVEKDPETGRNTSPKFDIGRNFATKLWNASRFVLGMLDTDDTTPGELTLVDKWMLSRLSQAIIRLVVAA